MNSWFDSPYLAWTMGKKNQSPKVRMKREHAKAGKDLKFELKVKVLYIKSWLNICVEQIWVVGINGSWCFLTFSYMVVYLCCGGERYVMSTWQWECDYKVRKWIMYTSSAWKKHIRKFKKCSHVLKERLNTQKW